MKKVLIFGAGGFVGPYLAEEFRQHGYEVFGSDIQETDVTGHFCCQACDQSVRWTRLSGAPGDCCDATQSQGQPLAEKPVESSAESSAENGQPQQENIGLKNAHPCYFQADLLDAESVKSVIHTCAPDIIVNLAAVSSVGVSWNIPQTTISVNVVGALNIMEAARACISMPKLLLVGSSEEYEIKMPAAGKHKKAADTAAGADRESRMSAESSPAAADGISEETPLNANNLAADGISEETPLNANNPYGISKMAQESFAQMYRERYGMKIYCVRPFNHTGVGQRDSFVLPSFCRQAAAIEKSGRPGTIRVGNLAAERDFSDVRDIVRAYRMIVESEDCTEIYNVGSDKAYSLKELLEYIVSLCSQNITVETDPERFRPVDTPRICCDSRKIRGKLGWEPEYSIFDTLKEMVEKELG